MKEMNAEHSPNDLVSEQEVESIAPGEIVLGHITGIDSSGGPLVSYAQSQGKSLLAVSTLPLHNHHIGRQVALLFANGDLQKPLVIGLIHNALHDLLENFTLQPADSVEDQEVFDTPLMATDLKATSANESETIRVDGKRVVIEGQEEVTLVCGESSITLTKAGKIMIRGKYLLSRSSGVNRILGGSVQVN